MLIKYASYLVKFADKQLHAVPGTAAANSVCSC